MKKKMCKYSFAIICSIAMLFSLFPISAFADDSVIPIETSAEITEDSIETTEEFQVGTESDTQSVEENIIEPMVDDPPDEPSIIGLYVTGDGGSIVETGQEDPIAIVKGEQSELAVMEQGQTLDFTLTQPEYADDYTPKVVIFDNDTNAYISEITATSNQFSYTAPTSGDFSDTDKLFYVCWTEEQYDLIVFENPTNTVFAQADWYRGYGEGTASLTGTSASFNQATCQRWKKTQFGIPLTSTDVQFSIQADSGNHLDSIYLSVYDSNNELVTGNDYPDGIEIPDAEITVTYVFTLEDVVSGVFTLPLDDPDVFTFASDQYMYININFAQNPSAYVHYYDPQQFTLEYSEDGQNWNVISDENIIYPSSGDMQFRITQNEECLFSGVQLYDYANDDTYFYQPGGPKLTYNTGDNKYYFTVTASELATYGDGYELWIMNWNHAYNNQYIFHYDTRDDARVNLGETLIDDGEIYNFTSGTPYSFTLTPPEGLVNAYKIVIESEGEIVATYDSTTGFTYTPANNAGFEVYVYWTQAEYDFNCFYDTFDWENNFLLETESNGEGYVELADPVPVRQASMDYTYRYEVQRPGEIQVLKFDIRPAANRRIINININGTDYDDDYIAGHLDDDGYFCYEYNPMYENEIHLYSNFMQTSKLSFNEFDDRHMTAWYRYDTDDDGSYDDETWVQAEGFPVYYNVAYENIQIKIHFDDEIEGDLAGVKGMIATAPESATRYAKKNADKDCIFELETRIPGWVQLIYGTYPFTDEYQVNYDMWDGAAVTLGGDTIQSGDIYNYTFTEGQGITFGITYPGYAESLYKVIAVENNYATDDRYAMEQELTVVDGTFTYTPHSNKGFRIQVYWTESEYIYDHIYDNFDWGNQIMVKIRTNGNGYFGLDLSEGASPEPAVWGSRFGESAYVYNRFNQSARIYVGYYAYDGVLNSVNVNGDNFRGQRLADHMDSQGRFFLDIPAGYTGELNIRASFEGRDVNVSGYDGSRYSLEYLDGGTWRPTGDEQLGYLSNADMEFRVKVIEEGAPFSGLLVRNNNTGEETYYQPGSERLSEGENGWYYFTLFQAEMIGYCDGCELRIVSWTHAYDNEYVFHYDGRDGAGVSLGGSRVNDGEIYNFTAGTSYTFTLTPPEGLDSAYKVVISGGIEAVHNNVTSFTCTPDTNDGFEVNVYWTRADYDFETFYDHFDWEHNFKVETNSNGEGHVELAEPEAACEASRDCQYRYGVARPDETLTLKFDIRPAANRRIINININGTDYDDDYIAAHLDDDGYFCYEYDPESQDGINLYADFIQTSNLNFNEFDDQHMTAWYRYDTDDDGSYDDETWVQAEGFPVYYNGAYENIQVKIHFDDEIEGDLAGVKGMIATAPESATRYAKKNADKDCIFELETWIPGWVELIYGTYPFTDEYQVNYDMWDGAAVTLGGDTLQSGEIYNYTYTAGQGYTFGITYPGYAESLYKVIAVENNYATDDRYAMEQELTVVDGTFTYTPHSNKGFQIQVYWTESEYIYDHIYDNFDWENQIMVRIRTNGNGYFGLDLSEGASPEPVVWGSRFGESAYVYNRFSQSTRIYVGYYAYDGVLNSVNVNGDNFRGQRLAEHMDSQGRFFLDIPAGYTGELNIRANFEGRNVNVSGYDGSRYSLEYLDGGTWRQTGDEQLGYLSNADMEFRVKVIEEGTPFSGLLVKNNNTGTETYYQPGSERLSEGENGWYYFTLYQAEMIGYCDGCELRIVSWTHAYDNEYVFHYDGRDGAGVSLGGSRVNDGEIYNFTTGTSYTFTLTPPEGLGNAYKVVISGGIEAVHNNVTTFTCNPDTNDGFEVNVYWTRADYDFETFYDHFDWEHNFKVETNSNGEGHVELAEPEAACEASRDCQYRYGVARPDETLTLKFDIRPAANRRIINININGTDYDDDYIAAHLDDDGYFCYEYDPESQDGINLYADFIQTSNLNFNEFDDQHMTAWYRYDTDGDGSYDDEAWVQAEGFPVYYNSSYENIQVKIHFDDEIEGDLAGVKGMIATAPESATRYAKKNADKDCIFELETWIPGWVELIYGTYPFTDEYLVNYDMWDGAAITLGGSTLQSGDIYNYTYTEGQGITFGITYPGYTTSLYKVIAVENNYATDDRYAMEQELTVVDGTFTYTPHSDKGFRIQVYWTESEYIYDHIYDNFDWENQIMVKTHGDGHGSINLDFEEPDNANPIAWGTRFGQARYKYNKSNQQRYAYFNVYPNEGYYLTKVCINGTDYTDSDLDDLLDSEGRLKLVIPANIAGEADIYYEFSERYNLHVSNIQEGYTLQYQNGDSWETVSGETANLPYPIRSDMNFKFTVPTGEAFTGIILYPYNGNSQYKSASDETFFTTTSVTGGTEYAFTLPLYTDGSFEFGCDMNFTYDQPFDNQYVVKSDIDSTAVTVNGNPVSLGSINMFASGTAMNFSVTAPEGYTNILKAYAIVNGEEYEELTVNSNTFAFTPDGTEGITFMIIWTAEGKNQFDFDYFGDHVDYDNYYILEFTNVNGITVALDGIESTAKHTTVGDTTRALIGRTQTTVSFDPTLSTGKTLRNVGVFGQTVDVRDLLDNNGKLVGDISEILEFSNIVWMVFSAEDLGGDIADCSFSVEDATYTGQALTPQVTVTDGIATLTQGTHYTLQYSNNTQVGTGTVVVTGTGVYSGSKTLTFTINPCSHNYTGVDPTWEWTGFTAKAKFDCNNCDHVEEVTATVTSQVTKAASCTAPGETTYTATVSFGGTTYTDTKVDKTQPAAPGHDYVGVTPTWEWTGFTSAKAKFKCNNCTHVEEVTATVTSQVTKQPTCTSAGNTTYTATVTFGGTTYSTTNIDTTQPAATGHDYTGVQPTWEWTGYVGAKAKFKCNNCPHVEEVVATITHQVTKPATCTSPGETTYTATVTFKGKTYSDTKVDKTQPAQLAHDFSDVTPTWEWTGFTAKAKFKCKNCTHVEEITATITSQVTKPATCTAPGETTYTATVVFGGITYSDNSKVDKTQPAATGHDYAGVTPTWEWTGFTAKAKFKCKNCTHVEEVTATITSEVTTPATCTTPGVTTYTAKVTFKGSTYTNTKADNTKPAAAHKLEYHARVEATYEAEGHKEYWQCSVCKKYFTDSAGKNETTWANLVLPKSDKPDVEKVFDDVKKTDWFADSVAFVYARGIMKGMGGTRNFAPGSPLQREQFAIILWRLENCPSTAYENKFPDVPDGTWFTEPIMWAYKNGVITGYASGNFGVGDNITREQFAVMFFRYAKNIRHIEMKNYADISNYPDVAQVSDWAYEAMQWAVGNGIITGKQGIYLDPGGNAQRCEAATMIQRFMTKFGM